MEQKNYVKNLIEEDRGAFAISKLRNIFKRCVWILSPLIVIFSILCTFKANGLYPYGEKTISWCDMDQQAIPLLLQFKDVLAGKGNFFFSLKNAGGMNFYNMLRIT
jgi:uncharacterized membrane protein YfhO